MTERALRGLRGLAEKSAEEREAWLMHVAELYLERWGIVFRKLLEAEKYSPPWGELLRVLRRMEARGDIRGGRFVTRFSGEQFATSEAVALLRKTRREGHFHEPHELSVFDPLNLQGILTEEKRFNRVTGGKFFIYRGEFFESRPEVQRTQERESQRGA